MTGVLSTEHGAGLLHNLLDEGVPDPRPHRYTSGFADPLGDSLGADEVVHDRRPGFAFEKPVADDRRRRASR